MKSKFKKKEINLYTHESYSDGELKSTKSLKKKSITVESFYMSYISHIAITNRLSHAELKLLRTIAAFADWDDNSISFSPYLNKKILKMADISESTRRTCLCRLTAKNFLVKAGRGHYILNPKIFFKGEELARSSVIALEYQWDIRGIDMEGLDSVDGSNLIEKQKRKSVLDKIGAENLKNFEDEKEQQREAV